MYENDKFREECGVFGIWGHKEAAAYTGIGLTALQHRGQDSSGVVTSHERKMTRVCRGGTTAHLTADSAFKALAGSVAIGHVRYSTVGSSGLENAQPIMLECSQGAIALCHNGQIVNFEELKEELTQLGARWLTASDSELVLQLCKFSTQPTSLDAIIEALGRLKGSFSLLLLANDELIVARDSRGIRPLCMGRLGESVVVCSETCALDAVGAKYVRDIEPGEVMVVGREGIKTFRHSYSPQKAHCIFEHVYFSRPDSYVFGDHVGEVRMKLGRNLAREAPTEADIIVPVPDSGMWTALGYQEESELPLRLGIVRNTYIGRTFIEPHVDQRNGFRNLKMNPVPGILANKRVVLIDDSIVRGETMKQIVGLVRCAGAKEVHVRIGSPPTIAPCFYGINTPTKAELIAAYNSVAAVQSLLGADSLHYLSFESLLDAVGEKKESYCTACYTGKYRIPPPHFAGGATGRLHQDQESGENLVQCETTLPS
jgi:amidophosphoribosyltransferase